MNPTPQDVFVNQLLTNFSVAYVQDQKNFAALQAAPIVAVERQSGLFAKYNKGDFMRIDVQKRAPGTVAAESGYRTDNTSTYNCDVFGLRRPISDEERGNQQEPYKADRDTTAWLTQQMLLNLENIFVTNCMKTGVWGQDVTGVSSGPGANQVKQWDASGSTPLEDLELYIKAMRKATGLAPNHITMGYDVWSALKNHAELVGRVQYVMAEPVALDLVAKLVGVDSIAVSSAAVTTAGEGQTPGTSNTGFVAAKGLLLQRRNPAPGLMMPSACQTFAWTGYAGAAQGGAQIRSYRIEERRADMIEAGAAFDVKVVAADLGTYFTTLVS
jgi:hypothetical protein